MTAPHNRWDAQCLDDKVLKALRIVFIDILKYGPPSTIHGVRHYTPISNANNTVRLVVQDANTRGKRGYVEWETDGDSGQGTWNDFTQVAHAIEAKWPKSLTRNGRYDESCLKGAFVRLIELSYNYLGFPKPVNKCLKSIYVVPATARNEDIFGRYWYV